MLPPGGLQLHHLAAIHRAMRAHRRGGALLVVPDTAPSEVSLSYATGKWMHQPLAEANRTELASQPASGDCEETVPQSVVLQAHLHTLHVEETEALADLIGRFTAVDGIVVLNHKLMLQGFGGKVVVPDGFADKEFLHLDPRRDGDPERKKCKAIFHGMRHMSAAMACLHAGLGTLALVQSQDGDLTN